MSSYSIELSARYRIGGTHDEHYVKVRSYDQVILHRYHQGLKWQTINGDYSAMFKFYREVLDISWFASMH